MRTEAPKIDYTLNRTQAAARLGVSVRTLQRLEKTPGGAPQRVKVSERCIGYRNSEIDKFLESRVVA